MWSHVILVLELLSFISCINWVYGKRVKLDFKTTSFSLLLLVVLELMNYYQLDGWLSIIVHLLILVYCKFEFRQSVAKTILNWILFVITLSMLQFMVMVIVGSILDVNIVMRNIITNLIVLIICLFILPLLNVRAIRSGEYKKNNYSIAILGISVGVVLFLLLQVKKTGQINIDTFILAIPITAILLMLLGKWNDSQIRIECMENELNVTKRMQDNYVDLLNNVRLRQHEFKNHLAAIFSAHYTYKTYENLVKAQDEYCNKLMAENKYNNLLRVGNGVLAGFLYGKFIEIEDDGIFVEYNICTQIGMCAVADYYLIEMLGILLDNAVESVKGTKQEGCIIFSVTEDKNSYFLSVRNKSEYISYEDIEKMFQLGTSSKGVDRGLGLYHIKTLCQELECNIHCRNISCGGENWIEFVLEVCKADSE